MPNAIAIHDGTGEEISGNAMQVGRAYIVTRCSDEIGWEPGTVLIAGYEQAVSPETQAWVSMPFDDDDDELRVRPLRPGETVMIRNEG